MSGHDSTSFFGKGLPVVQHNYWIKIRTVIKLVPVQLEHCHIYRRMPSRKFSILIIKSRNISAFREVVSVPKQTLSRKE
jgi:hypothetical protein